MSPGTACSKPRGPSLVLFWLELSATFNPGHSSLFHETSHSLLLLKTPFFPLFFIYFLLCWLIIMLQFSKSWNVLEFFLRFLLLSTHDYPSVQFSSVTQSCPTLCDPMDYSTPGLPVHQQLPELTQTHVHWISDAIQPSHPLSSPSPPVFSLSQHQGLFQWVSSSRQVSKVLEFQLQHQSFQRIFRTDFL